MADSQSSPSPTQPPSKPSYITTLDVSSSITSDSPCAGTRFEVSSTTRFDPFTSTSDDGIIAHIPAHKLALCVAWLSGRSEVGWVELRSQFRLLNDNAGYVLQDPRYKETKLWRHGLSGSGEVIAIADSGIDHDNCFFHDLNRSVPVGRVRFYFTFLSFPFLSFSLLYYALLSFTLRYIPLLLFNMDYVCLSFHDYPYDDVLTLSPLITIPISSLRL